MNDSKRKPTWKSVTDVPCTCQSLQNFAADPANPIAWDQRWRKYQLRYQQPDCFGQSMWILFHCPSCGGVAPTSPPDRILAEIPVAEWDRLMELLRPIRSLQQAVIEFGPPDSEDFAVAHASELDDQESAPVTTVSRRIRYSKLSTVAEVVIQPCGDGEVALSIWPKKIQKQES